jgi:hypothetical protein
MQGADVGAACEQIAIRVDRRDERSPRRVVKAVAERNPTLAAALLLELSQESISTGLPSTFLKQTAHAIESGIWDFFGEAFVKQEFLGACGEFIIVAPYTTRRLGKTFTELSAIWAKVLPQRPVPNPNVAIRQLFGDLLQPLPIILPLIVMASAGIIADEGGEAFIVPDGWPGVKSGNGPALNNMGH